jgi:hypothetical protein
VVVAAPVLVCGNEGSEGGKGRGGSDGCGIGRGLHRQQRRLFDLCCFSSI